MTRNNLFIISISLVFTAKSVLSNILHILFFFVFFSYPEDVSLYNPEKEDQLTQFLNEVSKVFKDELVIQMNLAKKGTSMSLSNNFNHQIWSMKIYKDKSPVVPFHEITLQYS